MAGWTTPTDRTTGYVVSAVDWNIVEDNLTFLYGDTGWTNVTVFTGTWAVGAVQPRFMLLGRMVTLQGYIQSGTINTAAFTLPVGYRPSENVTFAAVANGAAAGFTITAAGVLTPQFGATTVFSIACTFAIV